MSFIRKEARGALWRWRETLIGAAVGLLGLYWALTGFEVLRWLGYFVIFVALALMLAGLQRVRFRSRSGGPGIVQIDEGQITYFGPLSGGMVSIRDLSRLTLDPTGKPAHWVLSQPTLPDLHIPVTAEGADALFDAFASLPGLHTEYMLSRIRRLPDHPAVIWQKSKGDRARVGPD